MKKNDQKSKSNGQIKEIHILKDESTRSLFGTEPIGNLKIIPLSEKKPIYLDVFEPFNFRPI